MENRIEKRKFPRFTVRKEIRIFSGNSYYDGFLENISDQGCLIFFDEPYEFKIRDEVRFEMKSSNSILEFRGVIIRFDQSLTQTKIAVFFNED